MKKTTLILCSLILLTCSSDDGNNANCNFLLNVGVNLTVNLNLPQFNQLQFVSQPIRVEGFGNEGIILVRTNANTLRAWDGADPNHSPSSCSALTINGIEGTCGCDDGNTYNLITGQATLESPQPCTLKPYRVEAIGNNTFIVSN